MKNIKLANVLACVCGLLLFLIGNRFGLYWQYLFEHGSTMPMIIFDVLSGFMGSYSSNILGYSIGLDIISLLCGLLTIGLAIVGFIWRMSVRKNYREGEEYGSSRYGYLDKEAGILKDEQPNKNLILSKNIQISMNTRKTFLNNNICVIGGSGSGKTRYFVKPNVLQMYCNYIITDPKLSLLPETGNAFLSNGYDIKVLDLIHPENSMHYNPFSYIGKPLDVYKFVNNLVANTNDKTKGAGGDQFFEKAEIALLTALSFFVIACGSDDEKNIQSVMELIDLAEASEEDEDMKSPLDFMFDELKEENDAILENMGNSNYLYKNSYSYLACLQYNLYKKAAGKTAKSILISLGVRMSVFNLPEVREILSEDTIDLRTIGSPKIDENGEYKKSVLFIGISDSDSSLNFLAGIMYQQLFDLLFLQADSRDDSRLPIHTRFILDEFANIQQIKDFDKKIAVVRSREISTCVILQNLAQLKTNYKDSWETIFGNCDTTLFLGGKEQGTTEYLSKMIGQGTFDYLNISETRGSNSSWSRSNQLINRALLDPAEISRLKPNECLVHIRGQHIFRDSKFALEDCPNIELTTDASVDALAQQNRFTNDKIQELKKGTISISGIEFDDEPRVIKRSFIHNMLNVITFNCN